MVKKKDIGNYKSGFKWGKKTSKTPAYLIAPVSDTGASMVFPFKSKAWRQGYTEGLLKGMKESDIKELRRKEKLRLAVRTKRKPKKMKRLL